MGQEPFLVVGIGDIHGRFHRVQEWLQALEQARGRAVDLALAVGDVEAFRTPDDHRRKAAKRGMPAEFADYASGARSTARPLYFIGGNNEDFESLHAFPGGTEVAPGFHYLGRMGERRWGGVRVAWLSGIHAPKHYATPLSSPVTAALQKQAGYFREPEVERLAGTRDVSLLLTHEWPRGLFAQATGGSARPWMGNAITRRLVDTLKPAWLFCGHSHEPLAATLVHPGGTLTRVACLDEAARPETAVVWVEWHAGEAREAGWGISGRAVWRAGDPWSTRLTPRLSSG